MAHPNKSRIRKLVGQAGSLDKILPKNISAKKARRWEQMIGK